MNHTIACTEQQIKAETAIHTALFPVNGDCPRCKLNRAAPDLLAAMEAMFEQCTMIHKHWGEGCNQKQAGAAIKAGREAIAKAIE